MTDKNTKFKDDLGRYLTNALFWETSGADRSKAIYTLKAEDWSDGDREYISIRKAYLELEDPTEYILADTYFFDYAHWQKICNAVVFAKHIDEWRTELDVSLRSRGVKRLIQEVNSGGKGSLAAAKFLISRGWDPESNKKRKAGRPSRDEVSGELAKQARDKKDLKADAERVFGSPKKEKE